MATNGSCATGNAACYNVSVRGPNMCRFHCLRPFSPAAGWDCRRAICIVTESNDMPVDFDAMPTLGDIPRHHARMRPAQPALTFEGRTVRWSELDAGASRDANALIAAGCAPGDRIAYAGKGTDEFFEL